MMESSEIIARPIEDVFAFLCALDERAPQVDQGTTVTRSPSGPIGPGTEFRFRQEDNGSVSESITRYIAIDPNRSIVFEAELGPLRPQCELTFEPVADGTRVTFRGDANPRGIFVLLSPLFNRRGQQVWSERLKRVKAVLESTSSP